MQYHLSYYWFHCIDTSFLSLQSQFDALVADRAALQATIVEYQAIQEENNRKWNQWFDTASQVEISLQDEIDKITVELSEVKYKLLLLYSTVLFYI